MWTGGRGACDGATGSHPEPVLRMMVHPAYIWVTSQPSLGFLHSGSHGSDWSIYGWEAGVFCTSRDHSQRLWASCSSLSPRGEGFEEVPLVGDGPAPGRRAFYSPTLTLTLLSPNVTAVSQVQGPHGGQPSMTPAAIWTPTLPWLLLNPPETTAISPRQLALTWDCLELTFLCQDEFGF